MRAIDWQLCIQCIGLTALNRPEMNINSQFLLLIFLTFGQNLHY